MTSTDLLDSSERGQERVRSEHGGCSAHQKSYKSNHPVKKTKNKKKTMGSQRDADKRSGAGRGVGEWVTHQPRERGGVDESVLCCIAYHIHDATTTYA